MATVVTKALAIVTLLARHIPVKLSNNPRPEYDLPKLLLPTAA